MKFSASHLNVVASTSIPNAKAEVVRKTASFRSSIWGSGFINIKKTNRSLYVVASIPIPNEKPEVVRKTVNYQPSIWGNRFIHYSGDDKGVYTEKQGRAKELKEKVRVELAAISGSPEKQLIFIDAIQRLGVAYHFTSEIEEALIQINAMNDNYYDLHIVSLRFRLLRENGYNVSSDIFNKFKHNKCGFDEHFVDDVQGLLSLYEAAHMRLHEEVILDEALAFSITHLKRIASDIRNPSRAQITRALKRPLRKSIPRIEARYYISVYEKKPSHSESLLMFAKLDFNMLQSLYRKELHHLSLWWKELDFTRKLPFARDRLVETYFWGLNVYFEPQYFVARRILTKIAVIVTTMDDIYDAYGTLDELKLFTDAIHRWDKSCIAQLPDYMKICYEALLDVFKEIECEMAKEGNLYRVYYAKRAMERLVAAGFEDAKWYDKKYIPSMDEYMQVALVTVGYHMLLTISLLGMGEIASKAVFDWAFKDPIIVRASATIFRLMNDIAGRELDQERGLVTSAIKCYVKENGVSEQVAEEKLKEVDDAWKTINGEFVKEKTTVPKAVLERVLNLTKVLDILYTEEDSYTHGVKEVIDQITSLLIDPMHV